MTPEWNALRVRSGREKRAVEAFAEYDTRAVYPKRTASWFVNGKKHVRDYPLISQIIYCRFTHQPMWHIMKERRIISGVFCRDAVPVRIPPDVIRQIMGLPTAAERLAKAKEEMARIRPGDKARFLDPLLGNFIVDIERVEGGRIWWSTMFGAKGETSASKLERQ